MTLTIQLPPEAESLLRDRAAREGQEQEAVAALIPTEALGRTVRPCNPAGLIAALDSFLEGDEEEQRTTLAQLQEDIDRDRPGQRSIFGGGLNTTAPEETDKKGDAVNVGSQPHGHAG